MKQLSFDVPLKPTPASRPRVTKRGVTFYPESHKKYEKELNAFLKTLPDGKSAGLVEVRLLHVMPPYKSSDYPTSRSDADNLAKLVMDCMSDGKYGKAKKGQEKPDFQFWRDDNLVVLLSSAKRFCRDDEEPHSKVSVFHLGDCDPFDVESYLDAKHASIEHLPAISQAVQLDG